MAIPDRLCLPLTFDPDRLQRDLARVTESDWIRHFVRQNYEGNWSVLALRCPATARHPIQMIYSDPTCQSFADTPLLGTSPYFQEVLAAFACPLRSVRLMRLTPGSIIKEHTDLDLDFAEGKIRLHIPIVTNDAVEFYLNQTRVRLEPGTCWYLRLSDPHRVVNGGTSERVHLVIDAEVNDWVTDLFRAAETGSGVIVAGISHKRKNVTTD